MLMHVGAVSRVVVSSRYEDRAVRSVSRSKDSVVCCGRVEREEWSWRCARCNARGVGNRNRCDCGMPVVPNLNYV
jgi:hypothetical protein